MKYAGLTDDPQQRRKDHGDPKDWEQRMFSRESEARAWEKAIVAQPGYKGDTGGEGWRYGYTYTITGLTRE